MRPSLVPLVRDRVAARCLAAVLIALGLACAAGAPSTALADGPPWTAAAPGDQRPQVPPNPRVVIPTDTVVSPPVAGFVPEDAGYVPARGPERIVGPNVSWGWISWDGIRTGAASGVHVTLISRQTGWRFSTTTDTFGRYRLALPDGNYDTLLEDQRLPYGHWTRGDTPYSGGDAAWNGGMSVGMGLVMYPRPLNSCRVHEYVVLDGVNGWAPGHDDTNTPCAATPDPVPATPWGPDLAEWAVTGKDRAPEAKSAAGTGSVVPVPALPVARAPHGRHRRHAPPRAHAAPRRLDEHRPRHLPEGDHVRGSGVPRPAHRLRPRGHRARARVGHAAVRRADRAAAHDVRRTPGAAPRDGPGQRGLDPGGRDRRGRVERRAAGLEALSLTGGGRGPRSGGGAAPRAPDTDGGSRRAVDRSMGGHA